VKRHDDTSESARDRILGAAFCAFMERGYANASTLDIATRAKVSKRELYSHFESKQALFAAGIAERTATMRIPLTIPEVKTREELAATLKAAGVSILNGVTGADVLALYRMAIAESLRSPDIATTLDQTGRGAIRQALSALLAKAQARGLIAEGDADAMADQFCSLLWSDLLVRLLLRVARRPSPKAMARRAQIATELLLHLHGATHDRAQLDKTRERSKVVSLL
jgi:AcrR family transcriptional regulator